MLPKIVALAALTMLSPSVTSCGGVLSIPLDPGAPGAPANQSYDLPELAGRRGGTAVQVQVTWTDGKGVLASRGAGDSRLALARLRVVMDNATSTGGIDDAGSFYADPQGDPLAGLTVQTGTSGLFIAPPFYDLFLPVTANPGLENVLFHGIQFDITLPVGIPTIPFQPPPTVFVTSAQLQLFPLGGTLTVVPEADSRCVCLMLAAIGTAVASRR